MLSGKVWKAISVPSVVEGDSYGIFSLLSLTVLAIVSKVLFYDEDQTFQLK